MAKDAKNGLGKEDQELVIAGAKAYRLTADEVFAASVKDGVATIVTIGGHKVTYKDGQPVKALHPLRAGRSIKPPEPPKDKE